MEIVERETIRMVGLETRSGHEDLSENLTRTWRALLERQADIPHRVDEVLIDVALDRFARSYLQMLGARVSRIGELPEDMRAIEIPAQCYIRHRHDGPVSEIGSAFGRMYDWAVAQGMDAAEFKLDIGYRPDGSEGAHELLIAIPPVARYRYIDGRDDPERQG